MSDYSAVAPPQNFSQSTAFAAALQRAKQIAAKINPNLASEGGTKRPLEDGSGMNTSEPETKKVASEGSRGNSGSNAAAAAAAQAAAVAARVAAAAAAGIQGLGVPGLALGPVTNEDIKVPDKMVGLIIGRGGEQISRLQTESGCKIQMAPDSGGLPERVCTLTGNAQAISRAKELIGTIVAQRSRTEGTGGARIDDMNMGGGPPNVAHVEIMVPGPKVGLIIGKGGETIKQLQEKSGAKMVVIQDGPSQENEKPLRISGEPQKVEHAKALVYELIAEKEIQRRDNEAGRGRGRGGGFDRMGGGGGGGGGPRGDYQDRGGPGRGWDNNGRGPGDRPDKAEATFSVPAAKCGVIIGRGGETIKQINQQTGAHCELDRRPPANLAEKTFVIRGAPDQIEQAKRLIAEKLGMPGPGGPNGGPQGQYPMGGGPQYPMGGPAQNWSGPGYQQPWQNPHPSDPSNHPNQYPTNQVPVNPQTGQPDYSQQWIEYYRSLGMHREADLIEQQTKASKGMAPQAPQGTPGVGQGAAQAQGGGQVGAAGATQNGQPDYSAQWAEYYRSIGKVKEAEAIEASMKAKQQQAGAGGTAQPTTGQPGGAGPQPTAAANPYPQNPYGYPTGGFYGGAPGGPQPGQPTPQQGAPQFAGYPNYAAYAGQPDNQ